MLSSLAKIVDAKVFKVFGACVILVLIIFYVIANVSIAELQKTEGIVKVISVTSGDYNSLPRQVISVKLDSGNLISLTLKSGQYVEKDQKLVLYKKQTLFGGVTYKLPLHQEKP